jgi:hypothetical protein
VLRLHPEESAEDRILQREYLFPAIRIYSPDRYEKNPYALAVAGKTIQNGAWEYKMQTYPPYRAAVAGDVETEADGLERMPLCFFDDAFPFFSVSENDNEWMTLTPVDLDTCEYAIERARGKVLTFGLGLGYYAYMASEKEEVESVTVVELSEKVIDLFKRHILPKMKNRNKINIVKADALEYAREVMPKEHFDLVFADTWRDASDGAPMYRRLKPLEALCPDTEFIYWIENFLISRCRAENYVGVREEMDLGKCCFDYEEFIGKIKKI